MNRFAWIAGVLGLVAQSAIAVVYLHWYESLAVLAVMGLMLTRPDRGIGLVLVIVSLDQISPVLAGVRISSAEVLLGVAVNAVWLVMLRERRRIDWRPIFWSMYFLAAVMVSGAASRDFLTVVPHLLRSAELGLAMWLVFNVGSPAKAGPFFFHTAVPSALLVTCFFGWLPMLGGGSFRSLASTFGNPNQFAGYLIALLPVLLVRGWEWRWSAVSRLLVVLGAVSLIGTMSRSGVAAALLGIGVTVFVLRLRGWSPHRSFDGTAAKGIRPVLTRAAMWAVVVLLVAGLAGIVLVNIPGFSNAFLIETDPAHLQMTLQLRLLQARIGLEMWRSSPWLGIGPGRYDDHFPAYQAQLEEEFREIGRRFLQNYPGTETWRARQIERYFRGFREGTRAHVHNLYLQLLVNYGFLGLAGFLAFAAFLLRHFWRISVQSIWGCAGMGLTVAVLAHNLVDLPFLGMTIELGLLLGATASLTTRLPDSPGSDRSQSRDRVDRFGTPQNLSLAVERDGSVGEESPRRAG